MLEKSTKEVADQYASQMIHFKSLPVSNCGSEWNGDS